MPFDFEDNYEDNYEQQQEEYAEEDDAGYRPADPIQERLQLASAYQALLERGVFSDGTPATDKVEREVQAFVRERLEILVGVRDEAPKASDVFSDEEVAVLKAFVVRLKTQQPAPPAAPKAPEVVKPAPAPTVKPVSAPKPPAVKTPRPRPAAPKPRKPREAAPRPAPTPKPAAPPKLPKKPAEQFAYDKGHKYPTPRSKEEAELVPDEEVFKVGPRFYKWRTNDNGLRYRVNVTPQIGQTKANDLYQPMPVGTMFTAISAAQAEQQTSNKRNALDMGGREHSHALGGLGE